MDNPAEGTVPRVTLQEIADAARVSRATVSLVLANRTEYVRQFRPETVARVRAIAQKMGYRSNLLASSLRSLRSMFFGLVLRGAQGTDVSAWHHQAFEGAFITGVLSAAAESGIYPVVATQQTADQGGASERLDAVLDGGVFGAIIRSPDDYLTGAIQQRIHRGVPMVAVFPDYPSRFESNVLDMDNRAAGRLAGRLLADEGRRRWLVVQDARATEAQRAREEGIREAGRELDASVCIECLPDEIGADDVAQWIGPRIRSAPPDGIFATSSLGSIGALLACTAAELRVPQQVSLVGVDASLWRVDPYPRITSIEVSWHEAGRRATQMLLECRDRGTGRFENVMLQPQVMTGMTCRNAHPPQS